MECGVRRMGSKCMLGSFYNIAEARASRRKKQIRIYYVSLAEITAILLRS